MAEWSTGDWHEDMVALHSDDTDTLVCWLQKKGGVEVKDIRLIEAAPELLAALEWAVETFSMPGGTSPGWNKCREAIKKAKGGAR